MAIRKFSTASISAGTNKSTKLWDQETFQSGMFAIATVSLTSSASSIEFSSIPSNYTHLQLRCISTTSRATYSLDQLYVRFNSDVVANYSWHELAGNGAAASAGSGSGAGQVYMNLGWTSSTVTASTFGVHIMDILDYKDTTKYKTIKVLGGMDINGTTAGYGGVVKLSSGAWRSTSAISTITITPDNNPFQANSHFALYGIKAG